MALVPWILVPGDHPVEHALADYHRTFDAWEEGGVRGIVFGHMRFTQDDGTSLPVFRADPKVYAAYGVAPPPETPRDPAKERQVTAMLDDAAARGWEILLFGRHRGGGARPLEEDPFGAVGYAAGMQDALNALPQAGGWIIDGAGEHHYELAFHHGGELFELRAHERRRLAVLGYDVGRLERGIAHLRERFHQLTPERVRYHVPAHTQGQGGAGLLAGLALFDLNEDALYWLRARQEEGLAYLAAMRHQVNRLNRPVKLGSIPRTATFSVLTAQDYVHTHGYLDYLFPKHYFWHHGFDGMYGTVARWVQRLEEWNPCLSEEDCFAVVSAWFGLRLPGIHTLADLELGFPDTFYTEVVASETRRALAAVGAAQVDKVIAWVSTGRHPHAGDPMPAHDLYRILTVSEQAGLKRFVFHPDYDLGAPEWSVISGLCGKRWRESPEGYWPSDTPRDTFSGGRKPGDP